jgi:hypothetical protein
MTKADLDQNCYTKCALWYHICVYILGCVYPDDHRRRECPAVLSSAAMDASKTGGVIEAGLIH